jgi:outer membrane protein
MKKTVLLLFSLLTSLVGKSQTALQALTAGEKLSLQQCIDIALTNNVQIKQSMLRVQSGEIQARQAIQNRLPNVNGSANQNWSFGFFTDPFTNINQSQSAAFNNFSINTNVTIFAGGQISQNIKQSNLNLQATQLDLQQSRDNVSLNVVLAYLQVLNAEDQVIAARNQLEVSRLQMQRTEKLVNAGSLPPANLFDLKSQVANDDLALINGLNTLDAAKLSLLQQMNINISQDVSLDRVNIALPSTIQYEATSQQVYESAQNNQAVVKAADKRIESALVGIKLAQASLRPTVNGGASMATSFSTTAKNPVTREDIPYFTQLNNNRNEGIGVSVSFPIFTRFNNKNRIALATIEKNISELNAQNVRITLRQNIEQAYVNMSNAAKRYEALNIQVSALEESFRVAESRYNAGAIDFVAYNVAKTNLDRARVNQIQAKYDFILRTKVLDFYQGKSLGF